MNTMTMRFGTFFLLLASLSGMPLEMIAAPLDEMHEVGKEKLDEALASQAKIDEVVAGAQERLIKYRALQKQIEGLKAYNEQLSIQVSSQQELIERFEKSLSQVALIERQMTPLANRMVGALEDFIAIDLPFHNTERQERTAFINENLSAADINVAEKYRQVIEAYQIENEYGRKIDAYQDIVTLEGIEREVDVLRIGRIALVCQTRDTRLSARWNPDSRAWEVLDNSTYRNAIRNGIKMARKQASIDILTLPVSAPEVIQ